MFPVVTQVESVHPLAEGILGLRLAASGLPPFEAGAHVDLHLGNGLARSYSLINPLDAEGGACPAHYDLAIGLAADSRGGSAWLHKALWPGMTLAVSAPRNHFALDDSMRPVLLVAGGIGVTPIRAMVQVCERRGRPWRLVYAARSRRHAAFVDEFLALDRDGRVQLHFDDEQGGRPLDIDALRGGIGPGVIILRLDGPRRGKLSLTHRRHRRPGPPRLSFVGIPDHRQSRHLTGDDPIAQPAVLPQLVHQCHHG